MKGAREHIGWLLWCINEGYGRADREDMNNWLLRDDTTLTEEDLQVKAVLLDLADEVIAVVQSGVVP